MKFKNGWKLVLKAFEENNRDKLYQLYLVEHQHRLYLLSNGVSTTLLSFNEYCEQVIKQRPSVDTRNQDEIMQEILGLKT